MTKRITLFALLLFTYTTVSAQLFVEMGVNAQFLRISRSESPSLSAISELIRISNGNPNTTIPKIINSRLYTPKLSIGYRIPFDDFNLIIAAGTSQDWGNSWKLRGTAAIKGKTYPYPECFSIRTRAYKTWETGFSLGIEYCYDNQKSETIINGSNLTPQVKGLLNQITDDMNLLGAGTTRFMQFNAVVGWQKTKDKMEFSMLALPGMVGTAFGVQADLKVRYFFGER
jgi:hypothetical protein